MKNSKTSKITFFVILFLITALTLTAFFGIENYYGDTRLVYVKGAEDIRWGIDISGGVEAVYSPDIEDAEVTASDIAAAKEVIETRLVSKNITDYEVYADNVNKQVIVRFPWSADESDFDAEKAISELGETAVLKFCANEDANSVLLSGSADIESAEVRYTEDAEPVVALNFTSAGTAKFADATGTYKTISIWMDDELVSVVNVTEKITTNNAVIEGGSQAFTQEYATELADKINAGSLPFAMTVDKDKLQIISPTLGSNALNVMLIAGAVAFAAVCLLMIIRYRLPGVIASLGLIGQIAGVIACTSGYFPAFDSFTLTVPGIAGIILSIGVGVDANVIAFERIRDEFRNGKTLDGAIAAGYSNSLSAVIDGNVTIVIISLVLMAAFGTPDSLLAKGFSFLFPFLGSSITGSIFSFGYTLIVGVVFNLIMGLWATGKMLKSLSRFKALRNPWLYGGEKTEKKKLVLDFKKLLKPALIVYAVIIVVGVVLTAIMGVNLDINFSGGARVSYSYEGDIDEAAIEKLAEETLFEKVAVSTATDMSGQSKQVVISVQGNNSLSAELQENLTTKLKDTYKDNKIELYDSNSVSPTIAGAFFAKSLVAVLLAGIGVVIYVGFRFKNIGGISAALMAYVALILDCIVAFLACTMFGLQVDSNLIAVILTLLGYSLNDTIVIYDRIRENKKLFPNEKLEVLANESLNAVKTRTLITTITTVLAVITIIVVAEIFGLTTLRSFAIPMAFGLVSGSISSLFISIPLWVKLKTRQAAKAKK